MIVYTEFNKTPLLFQDPISIITSFDTSTVKDAFIKMEEAINRGFYLAGFVAYEAGYAFEDFGLKNRTSDFPLVFMGVYKEPSKNKPTIGNGRQPVINNLRINIPKEKYFSNIDKIRDHIAKGDVYQITYCIKLLFEFYGDTYRFYNQLLKEQPVPYPSFIEADKFSILSLSPEKFMKKDADFIITKPMKGTWQRGSNTLLDILERTKFQFDKKNRAENVMIADLLRNDLGRIGRNVNAPRLFEVKGYKTLFQMTSTVTAGISKNISLLSLFKALFPSGSVTGAPKIRAMEIIREIEEEDRFIYTGAIGYIKPDKDLFFSIPIRSLLIENGHGQMGIGGGIVWDSTPLGEWEEGLLKAQFLTKLNKRPTVPIPLPY